MKFQTTILMAANAALISCAPLTAAPVDPAPAGTQIGDINTAGIGCKKSMSIIQGNLSILEFQTPGLAVTPTDPHTRKACTFNIPISYPAGYQYTVESVYYSGQASTPAGTTGRALGEFYFSGEESTRQYTENFAASTEKDFAGTYFPIPFETVWSPCGKGQSTMAMLNLKPEVRIDKGSAAGSVSVDYTDLTLKWRTC
jgi:hypothetical protein